VIGGENFNFRKPQTLVPTKDLKYCLGETHRRFDRNEFLYQSVINFPFDHQ